MGIISDNTPYWNTNVIIFKKFSSLASLKVTTFSAASDGKVHQNDISVSGQWCPMWECISWWRHQMETFPRYWHKGQWRRALMFSLICAWINGWANNLEAGDLRRQRAHYDVIVMLPSHHPTTHPPNYLSINTINQGSLPPATSIMDI